MEKAVKRGPKPKSNVVLRYPGDPKPKPPHCPAWLSKYAKIEWRRLCPLLMASGHLCELDRTILAAHCAALGDFRALTEQIERGEGLDARYNNPRTLRDNAWRIFQRTTRELGLSPSSRRKLPKVDVPYDVPKTGLMAMLTRTPETLADRLTKPADSA